jgi:hypothetical protein
MIRATRICRHVREQPLGQVQPIRVRRREVNASAAKSEAVARPTRAIGAGAAACDPRPGSRFSRRRRARRSAQAGSYTTRRCLGPSRRTADRGELERLGPVRLQRKRLPYPRDRRTRKAAGLGHLTGAPVRLSARRRFQRADDNLRDLLVGDLAWRARSRLVEQAVETMCDKSPSPFADRRLSHAQLLGDDLVVIPCGTGEEGLCEKQRNDRDGSIFS